LGSEHIKVGGSDVGAHGRLQFDKLGLCLLTRLLGSLRARSPLAPQFDREIELPVLGTRFGARVFQRVGKLWIGPSASLQNLPLRRFQLARRSSHLWVALQGQFNSPGQRQRRYGCCNGHGGIRATHGPLCHALGKGAGGRGQQYGCSSRCELDFLAAAPCVRLSLKANTLEHPILQ